MNYILYNPLSSNGKSIKLIDKVKYVLEKENKKCEVYDIIDVSKRIDSFNSNLTEEDSLILVGGDGTLHHFVNGIKHIKLVCKVFLFSGGTGNDFAREFKGKKNRLIDITEYIKELPSCAIDETEQLFINGCGFGVDGDVCVLVNSLETKKKGLKYFKSSIGLLKRFKRYDLELFVDGVRHIYKKVWFVTIQNGKYFGGGMKVSPYSNRLDNVLEANIIHSVSFWKLLLIFPLIFLGKHLKFNQVGISLEKGKHFVVKADRALNFQTDGEVITGVKEFEIYRNK